MIVRIAGDRVDGYDNWYWNGNDGVPHVPSWSFTDVIQFDESFRRIESLGCEPIPATTSAYWRPGSSAERSGAGH